LESEATGNCLTKELDIKINFENLQMIVKDVDIRCRIPKLELEHTHNYDDRKEEAKN